MLRALVLGLACACACGSGDNASSPGVASGVAAEAGKVRELTGKVTAARGSEIRTLAVGTPITADDVIDTGTDGSVVIELVHNNALWSLEPGIKARVDQSPAWTLAKQDAAKPIDHATSAAGRHADRQAADTQVTAIEQAKVPEAPGAATTDATAATKQKDPKPRPEAKRPTVAPKITAPGKSDDAGCDEVSCVMSGEAPCCARYRKSSKGTAPTSPAAELPDAPDRSSVMSAIQAVRPKLTRCFDKLAAAGTLKIEIRFGGSGKVETAQIKETPDHASDSCVLNLVKTVTVPASRSGLAISFPIVLRLAE